MIKKIINKIKNTIKEMEMKGKAYRELKKEDEKTSMWNYEKERKCRKK